MEGKKRTSRVETPVISQGGALGGVFVSGQNAVHDLIRQPVGLGQVPQLAGFQVEAIDAAALQKQMG